MSPVKRFLLMLALTCMWSPSFLFIKLAVEEIPPLTIASSRVTLAAIMLTMILYGKGFSFPRDRRFWMCTSIMAFFASVLPFYLFCYAETSIDSALAAIINGTTPMFTAVLAQIFVSSDRMTPQKVLGVLFSCCGVLVLFARQLTDGVNGTMLGLSAATLAAFCYSVSHVYGKLYTTGSKPFVAPASQLVLSSLMLLPFSLLRTNIRVSYALVDSHRRCFGIGDFWNSNCFCHLLQTPGTLRTHSDFYGSVLLSGQWHDPRVLLPR